MDELPTPVLDCSTSPLSTATRLKTLYQDAVLPITAVIQGDDTPAYNRTWFRLNDEAFAHSGSIQPVKLIVNSPNFQIPVMGRLAEVTVPYSDAFWWTNSKLAVAYRLYYATTHWVTGIKADEQGVPHYAIYDEKRKATYYAPARHLRLVPPEEFSPLSTQIDPADKLLSVSLKDQLVVAYEAGRPVFMARAATGGTFSNGIFSTPVGPHQVLYKCPGRHMAAGDRAAPNSFDLPGVPWVTYITEDGLAFHGTYWHNDFGKPRSHGCINLTPQAAHWVYRWTQPVVPPEVFLSFAGRKGTRVEIV